MCLHRLAVVGNIDIGARGFCEEKYKASRTKFGVRSSVEKWVPSMRGLRSTEVGTHEKHGVLLLDVFSGTAGVAAASIQLGGEALGLDHVVDKKRVRGPVAKVDLCKRESQELVFKWLVTR